MSSVSAASISQDDSILQPDKQCKQCMKSILASDCFYIPDFALASDEASNLLLCSACCNAMYCSAGCQKQHWRIHKPVCTLLAAQRKPNNEERQNQIYMKQWLKLFNNVIVEATILSNDLINHPENMFKSVLHIVLRRTTETDLGKLYRFFELDSVDLWDMEVIRYNHMNYTLIQNGINECVSRNDPVAAITFIKGGETGTARVFGFDEFQFQLLRSLRLPTSINWKADLREAIATGRTTRKRF